MNFYDLHEEVADAYARGYFDDLSTDDGSYDDAVEKLAKIHQVDRALVDFLARSLIEYQDDFLYEKVVEDVQQMLADGYFEDHSSWEAADDLTNDYCICMIDDSVIEAIVEAETEDEE